jgi:hypothetical protein
LEETAMIFRLTQKLAKKLNMTDLPQTDTHDNGSAWYGNLFRVGGIQYILLTESLTLFSFVFHGKGIVDAATLTNRAKLLIETRFKENGWLSVLGTHISFDLATPTLLAAQDRSVLSSMNGMLGLLKSQIEEGKWDLEFLSNEINIVLFTKNGVMNDSESRVEQIAKARSR